MGSEVGVLVVLLSASVIEVEAIGGEQGARGLHELARRDGLTFGPLIVEVVAEPFTDALAEFLSDGPESDGAFLEATVFETLRSTMTIFHEQAFHTLTMNESKQVGR